MSEREVVSRMLLDREMAKDWSQPADRTDVESARAKLLEYARRADLDEGSRPRIRETNDDRAYRQVVAMCRERRARKGLNS